jgi:catechol 2,3-dioxygenase-like lactoylglutathione lyase family enzyme
VFDHVTLRIPELELARSAFGAVLDERRDPRQRHRGISHVLLDDRQRRGIGDPTADRRPRSVFRGSRFHADATAAGYRSNGQPGERPRYHDGYYAAFVLDPDGNNIEVVDHHR